MTRSYFRNENEENDDGIDHAQSFLLEFGQNFSSLSLLVLKLRHTFCFVFHNRLLSLFFIDRIIRCDQLKNKSSRRVTYGNPCYSIGSKANSIYFLNDRSVLLGTKYFGRYSSVTSKQINVNQALTSSQ
jgi:hypothetical protein